MNLAELSTFATSLSNLSQKEIQKAKVLFLKNQITEYKASYKNQSFSLVWVSIGGMLFFFLIIRDIFHLSALPFYAIFLALLPLFFIFTAFSQVITGLRTEKQQISNALEIWKEDLGNDYLELKTRLKNTKSNIPIISIFLNN